MNDKLMDALKVIKEECKKQDNCLNCPLRISDLDSNYLCNISNTPKPENWVLEYDAPRILF